MIDKKELDAQTIAMAEIMAADLGISLDDFLKVIDEAKKEYYTTRLS